MINIYKNSSYLKKKCISAMKQYNPYKRIFIVLFPVVTGLEVRLLMLELGADCAGKVNVLWRVDEKVGMGCSTVSSAHHCAPEIPTRKA